MIRVVITGASVEGRFPYRIDVVNTRLAAPYKGLDAYPLYDACKKLQDLGAASDEALVWLFIEGGTGRFTRQTTVGYGANFGRWDGLKLGDTPVYFDINGAQQAISEEPPPPPHTPPEPPADTGPDFRAPDRPGQSHHKRKLRASSGRRGSR